jgi:iron(III) transport system substrate-binding protein
LWDGYPGLKPWAIFGRPWRDSYEPVRQIETGSDTWLRTGVVVHFELKLYYDPMGTALALGRGGRFILGMRLWPLILALAVLIVGPILLRPHGESAVLKGQDTVVVITPHNEAIRVEFGRGFRDWYQTKTGRSIVVDFRTPGGTSEITKFLGGEYDGAFRHYWENKLGRKWSAEVAAGFVDGKIKLDETPGDDTEAQAARRAFLASDVGCSIDVFFGGGSFDFQNVAGKGLLVNCGYVEAHQELFGTAIPLYVGGEPYYDPEGRWVGTTIGAFGIASNRDQLARLKLPEPKRWEDLADPRFFRGLALANPTQSSSANKAIEMLIQEQMNEAAAGLAPGSKEEERAVAEGWTRAMRLLQRISANARYFTDSSAKISLDVEAGEAAAGMTIDFYGRFQSEMVRRPDGTSRIAYTNAEGGTSYGVDPIGLLRGAPHRGEALAFIEYVMTDGQKLWGWKAGAPGGPRQHALRRLPVLPSLYAPEHREMRSDPDIFPYELAKEFRYTEKRTAALFRTFAFIIRVMCIDTHDELKSAWEALIAARQRTGSFPPEALAAFEDVAAVDYAAAQGSIRKTVGDKNKINEVQLAKDLAAKFRANYRRAAELARAGR